MGIIIGYLKMSVVFLDGEGEALNVEETKINDDYYYADGWIFWIIK